MHVVVKQTILDIGFVTDEERGHLIPGTVFKVMLHEVDEAKEEWYLIKFPIERENIFMSEEQVERGEVIRYFKDPELPDYYEEGPYLWIEASNFRVLKASTNKEAKSFLKNYDWHLD